MKPYQDPVDDIRCAEIIERLAARWPARPLRSELAAMTHGAQALRQLPGRNCAGCDAWDGDAHCSLPREEQIICHVRDPELAVCAKWRPKDGGYGHGV